MGIIAQEVIAEKRLTIFRVSGTTVLDEIIEVAVAFLTGSPTLLALWDFTDADVHQFTSEEIQKTAFLAARYGHTREGGKTAIVFPGDLGFGIGRMYESYTEHKGVPFETRVFHSISEAMEWLGLFDYPNQS